MGVVDRGGQLEVEITQARSLTPKPGSKNIPGNVTLCYHVFCLCAYSFRPRNDVYNLFPSISATYVKVYVLENGMCLSKKKTKVVKKTLDPTFQQSLMFDESPQGKVLQVWEIYQMQQGVSYFPVSSSCCHL